MSGPGAPFVMFRIKGFSGLTTELPRMVSGFQVFGFALLFVGRHQSAWTAITLTTLDDRSLTSCHNSPLPEHIDQQTCRRGGHVHRNVNTATEFVLTFRERRPKIDIDSHFILQHLPTAEWTTKFDWEEVFE